MRQSDEQPTGDAMTVAIVLDNKPFTESDFLAIGETPERIELFDGSLHVTPAPLPRHQYVCTKLAFALSPAAQTAGLHVLETVNVRCAPDRIPIPDLVITTDIDFDELVIDASAVRLACEILSPSNSTIDKVLKMHYYAAAEIPWYLLIDPVPGTMQLFSLAGQVYQEHAAAAPGVPLQLTDPVVATIDPADLLPPR
jgi:Uma2 family endonuclease